MNRTWVIFLFVTLQVMQVSVLADDERVVKFKENEEIRELKPSQNYLAIKVYDKSNWSMKALLFDKEGNEIYQKYRRDYSIISFLSVVEKKNLFIVVYGGDEVRPDILEAYDLVSGSVQWIAESQAGRYALSPNMQYIMPVLGADIDGAYNSEIINLDDGAKVDVSFGVPATWLDNERIVYLLREYGPNENYGKHEFVKLEQEKEKLRRLKSDLRLDYRKKNITKDQMNEKINNINDQENEIRKQLRTYRATHKGGYPHREVEKSARIVVYNIETKSKENEKTITDSNGKNVLVSLYSLIVDEGTVILFCDYVDRKQSIAIAMDKSLTTKYEQIIGKAQVIGRIHAPDRQYISYFDHLERQQFLFDVKTGQKMTLEEVKASQPNLGEYSFNNIKYMNHFIDKDIEVIDDSILIKSEK